MKNFTLLFLFLASTCLMSQEQIGTAILALDQGDQFGSEVEISDNGLRIIGGAPFGDNANGDTFAGYVIVSEFVNGSWVQLGQTLEGDNPVDQFGITVAISGDGTTVASAAPFNDENGTSSGKARIFRLENDTWVQVGQDLTGPEQSLFGTRIDLSRDGNIVAVSDGRSVRVFRNVNNTWEILGNEIFEASPQSSFGRTVSLSANGLRVAIGAPFNDDAFTNSGEIRVFDFINGSWSQIGQDINGDEQGAAIGDGDTVSLSGDGNVLAIGFARFDTDSGNSVGQVRLYTLTPDPENTWEQIDAVDGLNGNDLFGTSVSLTDDGMTLAALAPSAAASNAYTRVYRNDGNGYLQLGEDIISAQDNERRTSVSENSVVALGYPFAIANGVTSGVVRAFDLNNAVLSVEDVQRELDFKLFPNPTTTQLTLQVGQNINVTKVSIYNMLGQLVLSSDQKEHIDISSLRNGSYIVSASTEQGILSEIFIKN